MPPDPLTAWIETMTGPIRHAVALGGGDTAAVARVESARGTFVVKWGERDTFTAEAQGLAALAAGAGSDLVVPEPLAVHVGEAVAGLLLPWLERGRPTPRDWRRFGAGLAALHRGEAPGDGAYGWASDNWIGSKPQRNGWSSDWPTFLGERRLLAQAETVRQRGAWNDAWTPRLDRLVARLPDLLPARPEPSLLHGDLWSGNALALTDGRFALIDPAVSVGHREADLAMTELFGGFDAAFYDGYADAWPLQPGYPERREVYNLFHLINHLTHGPGYRAPVEQTLRRFG